MSLREELSEKIYHWIYVQAHPEYTADKMSRKADRFADQILSTISKHLPERAPSVTSQQKKRWTAGFNIRRELYLFRCSNTR